MPFNSYAFLIAFLPVVLVGTVILRRRPAGWRAWLLVCSWVFYGWWNPAYLPLLLVSIGVNHGIGRRLRQQEPSIGWLRLGLVFNLGLLGLCKYADLAVTTVGWLVGAAWTGPGWELPLGISFFTFQQVAFLVDAWRHQGKRGGLASYALFVSYFPQLVAGPIVHHRDLLPQLERPRWPVGRDVAVGWTIFVIGLFKKCMIADTLAPHADAGFALVDAGRSVPVMVAWGSALAYSLQLYFDFSGYSDMAIGLARMMGIRLPANFDAPYRANDIAEFWRRWHVTLSSFLRDYLYIPLGGNRQGQLRQRVNLMVTMLLGGLWHGAGWNFLAWGGLHGAFLVVHRMWRGRGLGLPSGLGRLLTGLIVVLAWVPFRASTWGGTVAMWTAMVGATPKGLGVIGVTPAVLVLVGMVVTQVLPTTQTWMAGEQPTIRDERRDTWAEGILGFTPTAFVGLAVGAVFLMTIPWLERAKSFLYWQF